MRTNSYMNERRTPATEAKSTTTSNPTTVGSQYLDRAEQAESAWIRRAKYKGHEQERRTPVAANTGDVGSKTVAGSSVAQNGDT